MRHTEGKREVDRQIKGSGNTSAWSKSTNNQPEIVYHISSVTHIQAVNQLTNTFSLFTHV